MFCPKCGKELKDGTKFCPGCGYKLWQAAGNEEAALKEPEIPRTEGAAQFQPAEQNAVSEAQPLKTGKMAPKAEKRTGFVWKAASSILILAGILIAAGSYVYTDFLKEPVGSIEWASEEKAPEDETSESAADEPAEASAAETVATEATAAETAAAETTAAETAATETAATETAAAETAA